MKTGNIVWYHKDKNCGIIESHLQEGNGRRILKFFFHKSDIAFLTIEPHVGCFVRFNVSDKTPKKQGGYPYAVGVEIYEHEGECPTVVGAEVLAGTKTELAKEAQQ